ncbi:MAG: Co2+/Mg2+ efflux protein ApaG [Methyloprofundus sp.]|nr:Co2+/Mg2+ efflux protein ApaG [Methyloprofundus sp.]
MSEKNKILVDVTPRYIAEQSKPNDKRFVFAYKITITNIGSEPAKLIRRKWLITDSNGKIEEVQGDGVIGQTPHLKVGESFAYTSGALIKTSVGTMEGKYIMQTDTGEEFDAIIPRFTLSIPRTLH